MSRVKVVRDLYRAYETGDRAPRRAPPERRLRLLGATRRGDRPRPLLRALLAERAGDRGVREYHRLIEAGDEVVVTYEATRTDGRRFRKPQAEGAPC
jgi:hypothetical protein